MKPVLGLRVVRGPDWEWGDQDGGEGFVGTVVGAEEGGRVATIQWDMGYRSRYRCGHEDKSDIRVLDNAQIGVKHSEQCAGCGGDICGFLWRCIHCFECGSLCSHCYMSGEHSTLHCFMRIDTSGGVRVRVPSRDSSRTVELSGIFVEAEVVRGADWTWGNQDRVSGNPGYVRGIKDWKDAARSTVEVLWKEKQNTNIYRLGINGKVDVKCIKSSSGGTYYPEHLPPLGDEKSVPTSELAAGDQVKVTIDPEMWKKMQEGYGEWDDRMSEFNGTAGVIQHITDSGGLIISYPGQAIFHVNPNAVTKEDVPPVYKVRDVVNVINDKDKVSRLQKGHGDWLDEMAESLGGSGEVVKVMSSGDVQVAVAGRRWVFSPYCLLPATVELGKQQPIELSQQLSDVVKAQLESLKKQASPELVVAASAAGDLSTLRTFLQEHPEAVDTKVQGKTGLLVATAEGWPEVVKALLNEFNANPNEPDEEGDTALHYCAHLDRDDIAKELLAHNANPNTCNNVGAFPLIYATALGNYNVLRILATNDDLDHHLQDNEGNTALHVAVAAHRSKAVSILLEAGATPTVPNHSHYTPILSAANTGFYLGLEQFIKRYPGAVGSDKDADGNTALHIAVANNHLDTVCLLADDSENCNVNAPNTAQNQTPLHIACREGNTRVIERLLVRYEAKSNVTDAEGNTPLKLVVANRDRVKTPSQDSPQTLQISMKQSGSDGAPLNYVAVACLLARRGANVDTVQLQTMDCDPQAASLIASYQDMSV